VLRWAKEAALLRVVVGEALRLRSLSQRRERARVEAMRQARAALIASQWRKRAQRSFAEQSSPATLPRRAAGSWQIARLGGSSRDMLPSAPAMRRPDRLRSRASVVGVAAHDKLQHSSAAADRGRGSGGRARGSEAGAVCAVGCFGLAMTLPWAALGYPVEPFVHMWLPFSVAHGALAASQSLVAGVVYAAFAAAHAAGLATIVYHRARAEGSLVPADLSSRHGELSTHSFSLRVEVRLN